MGRPADLLALRTFFPEPVVHRLQFLDDILALFVDLFEPAKNLR